MSRAKVSCPASMRASISASDVSFGGRNHGAWKAWVIRSDRVDWSSSTIEIVVLWSVSGAPTAMSYTVNEKA